MNRGDRHERANRILSERSAEAERRAAALAIQAQMKAEQRGAQRQQKAADLSRYAMTVLDRLDQRDDQGGYSEVESVKVRTVGRFKRVKDTYEVGLNMVDTATTKYYLLLDGTFVRRERHVNERVGTSEPWEPDPASIISPENIVDNPDVYRAMLRSLEGLGGPPERE